jgi:hypothetical protein
VRAGLEILANDVEFMSARGPSLDLDDDAPVNTSVADERRDRRMPEAAAVAGTRGSAALDRDDALDELPF